MTAYPAGTPTACAGDLDVLIPTCGRPGALAVALAGLAGQTATGFRVVIADQTLGTAAVDTPEVRAVLGALRHRGSHVDLHRGRPRRGMAEQRQFLLDAARARHVLYLDDDVLCEPGLLGRLLAAIRALRCGFVGAAPQGLSHLGDVRPDEHEPFEPVTVPVRAERVRKGTVAWERWRLHNAANLTHIAERVAIPPAGWLAYRVTWVGGCVLFNRADLVAAGGFEFWRRLPPGHRGEDVVAQLRVMERAGGVGVLPAGVTSLELPTTVTDRRVDAYAEIIEADDRAEAAGRGTRGPPASAGRGA
jgi:GT2 family glycosyltransferase